MIPTFKLEIYQLQSDIVRELRSLYGDSFYFHSLFLLFLD